MPHTMPGYRSWTRLLLGVFCCLLAMLAQPIDAAAEEQSGEEEHATAEERVTPEEHAAGEEHEGGHEPLAKGPPYLGSQRSWLFVSMLPGEDDAETLGLEFESYFDLGPFRVKNISYFELNNYPRPIPGQPPGNPSPGTEIVDWSLGDLLAGFWASGRAKPHGKHHVAWGLAFQFPTADSESLGSGKYALGPTVDYEYESGKWFAGAIALQLWSVAGDSNRKGVNFLMIKPFVYYQLSEKWQATYVPYGISVYWEKPSGEQVYFPVGGGFQRTLGKRANASLQFFQNVLKPNKGTKYDLRLMFEIVFE